MLEALRARLRAYHRRPGKHRLVPRTAPALPRHRASGRGGFDWRGHFIPLSDFPGGIAQADIERLRKLPQVHWSWPL